MNFKYVCSCDICSVLLCHAIDLFTWALTDVLLKSRWRYMNCFDFSTMPKIFVWSYFGFCLLVLWIYLYQCMLPAARYYIILIITKSKNSLTVYERHAKRTVDSAKIEANTAKVYVRTFFSCQNDAVRKCVCSSDVIKVLNKIAKWNFISANLQ